MTGEALPMPSDRFVSVPGLYNMRDLGGLAADGGPIRPRVLLRSEAPIELGAAGRDALRALGVRTAIDLRQSVEVEIGPLDVSGLAIDVRSVPVFGTATELERSAASGGLYHTLLKACGAQLAAAVDTLATPGVLPAVVFCSAGRDRTGLVIALALSAVGVSDQDIAEEYALTDAVFHGAFRDAVSARAHAAGFRWQSAAVRQETVGAALMQAALDELTQRYGGAVAYLTAHGLSEQRLQSLRTTLVQSDESTT